MRIERMESAYGGTAMTSLLGHGGANEISSLLCAFERGRAEFQDARMRRRDAVPYIAVFVPRSSGEECGSGVAGHWIDGIARKRGVCIVQMRVSPDQFLTCSVTASGHLRRPAARHRSAFWTPLPEQVWAPAPECTAWRLGVAPTRIASPGVTRADREFKSGDSQCI
jgi:hypothetical protein